MGDCGPTGIPPRQPMTSLRSPPPPLPTPRSWTIGAGGRGGSALGDGLLRRGRGLESSSPHPPPRLAEAPHSLPPDVRPLAWLRRRGRGGPRDARSGRGLRAWPGGRRGRGRCHSESRGCSGSGSGGGGRAGVRACGAQARQQRQRLSLRRQRPVWSGRCEDASCSGGGAAWAAHSVEPAGAGNR